MRATRRRLRLRDERPALHAHLSLRFELYVLFFLSIQYFFLYPPSGSSTYISSFTGALRFRGCRCRDAKSKHTDDAHGGRSKGKGRARADDDADWGGDAVGGHGVGRGDGDADPCADDDCPCRAHGRECDPELCVGCGARYVFFSIFIFHFLDFVLV